MSNGSAVAELQQLIREGRVVEATNYADLMYAGTPLSARHYELLGDLEIQVEHSLNIPFELNR